MRRWVLSVGLLLGGCGTLVDDVVPPVADGGTSSGLVCAADDPCTCQPCSTTDDCMAGLSCVEARRRGVGCAVPRTVCLTGP